MNVSYCRLQYFPRPEDMLRCDCGKRCKAGIERRRVGFDHNRLRRVYPITRNIQCRTLTKSTTS